MMQKSIINSLSDILKITKNLFNIRLFRHSLFWIGNLFFFTLIFFLSEGTTGLLLYLLKISIVFSLLAIVFYIHQSILIPRFYKEKKYLLYMVYLFLGVLLFTVLKYTFKFYVFHEVPDNTFIGENGRSMFIAFSYIITGSIISSFLRYNREKIQYQEMAMKLKESEKQKLEAELVTLKAQVNPHFMFNTLNNIYSLSLDKSEKTPEMILKLSDLMSYTLYDCKAELVNISEEIRFVKNYFELEKIRMNPDLRIELDISGTVPNKKIAPLLLIPFIENAFKHGNNTESKNPFIHCWFNFIKEDQFVFTIENSKMIKVDEEEKNPSGIGIANSRKRLNLLYPDKHKLNIIDNQDIFQVKLEIDLR